MGFLQIVIVALSVAAAYGGSYGADRLMDRFGRVPTPQVEQADIADINEDADDNRS